MYNSVAEAARDLLVKGYNPNQLVHKIFTPDWEFMCLSIPLELGANLDGLTERYYRLGDLVSEDSTLYLGLRG